MAKGKKNQQPDDIRDVLKKLGDKLIALREAKGETSSEKFAFKNDLNRSQLWRYENGHDLNFSSLLKVLKVHNITLAEFFKEGFDG